MSVLDDITWPATRSKLVEGFRNTVHADQIERLFLSAQTPGTKPRSLSELRVGRRADEPVVDQLTFALDEARAARFVRYFAFALVDQLPASSRMLQLVQAMFDQNVDGDAVHFQAMANMLLGFDQPDEIIVGMHQGRLNTCIIKVSANGVAADATGFLIRSDLVLTSFHTFRNTGLIQPGSGTTSRDRFKAAPESGKSIRLFFNNFRNPALGGLGFAEGTPAELEEDWLVAASDYAAIGPHNLDYVLIKLASCPPTLASGLTVAPADFPADATAKAKVYLFQHPLGKPIRVAHGPFRIRASDLARDGLDVNSLEGSSGGPCTNRSFQVFAMHQGEVADHAQLPELAGAVNLAIPIGAILADIGPLPMIGVRPRALVVNGPFGRQPLFGRRLLCSFAARAIQANGPRILIVRSGSGDKGLGMTFSTHVLSALLREDDHMILRVGAEQGWHTKDPITFCELLLGVQPGQVKLRTQAEAATSQDKWLAGPLLDDLRKAMRDKLARPGQTGGRMFWLILDDLDKIDITEGKGLREFLVELYREAANADWLRVVLLGYRGPLLDQGTYRTETEEIWPMNPQVIKEFLDELDTYLEIQGTAGAVNSNFDTAQKAMKALLIFGNEARTQTEAIARFIAMMADKSLMVKGV
jgi:hypothetical protein